jgi:hypothetical protein
MQEGEVEIEDAARELFAPYLVAATAEDLGCDAPLSRVRSLVHSSFNDLHVDGFFVLALSERLTSLELQGATVLPDLSKLSLLTSLSIELTHLPTIPVDHWHLPLLRHLSLSLRQSVDEDNALFQEFLPWVGGTLFSAKVSLFPRLRTLQIGVMDNEELAITAVDLAPLLSRRGVTQLRLADAPMDQREDLLARRRSLLWFEICTC